MSVLDYSVFNIMEWLSVSSDGLAVFFLLNDV